MLSLSCYRFVCHYFLYLLSTLCTHTCYFSSLVAMLCCSEDEEFFDEDYRLTGTEPIPKSYRKLHAKHLPIGPRPQTHDT
jgi:hypothetical protein